MISQYEKENKFYCVFEIADIIRVSFQIPLPEYRYSNGVKMYLVQEIKDFIDALEENIFCELRFDDLKILLDDNFISIKYAITNTSIEIRSVAASRHQLRDVLGKYLKYINHYREEI